VGVVLDALDRNGIRGNTIVVFSSDNGSAGFSRQVEKNAPSHRCSGPLRGRKGSLWDGGHRVPFVLSWPAKVKPGSETDQLVCLGDFLATMADLLAVELPDDMGEDSESFLPALFEEPIQNPRKVIVHHDIAGRFSIRQGQWKLLLKSLGANQEQLYNLKEDLGESTNLARNYPKKVKELLALLEEQVANGRSTPGASQKNDVKIDLWKIAGK
jgi:arylsulfatase A-like enzyme